MTNQNLTKIREISIDGKDFVIAQDTEGRYWSFHAEDIDRNGMLTKQYNGITGHMSNSLNETLKSTWLSVKSSFMDGVALPTKEMWDRYERLFKKATEIFG